MLDPHVLSSIADLELVARVIVDGTIAGLHRSPFHGYSAEFSQYRHYRPGDDLKYVDWKLLARTDRIYTKQYRETANTVGQLALDASASMDFAGREGISKFAYARMLAAALAHLIAGQGDAAGLVLFDDGVRQFAPARTGHSQLRSLLVTLARAAPSGRTATAGALRRAIELMKRRGLLVVLSDLYDEDTAAETELRRAVRIGHEVAMFHVLTRDELALPAAGDVEFEDMETGSRVAAHLPALQPAYRQRIGAFLERWRSRCAGLGIDYTLVTTDMPLEAALRGYLLRRAAATPR